MVIVDMPRLLELAILLCLTGGVPACATLKLNGCSKLAECGELAVYSCDSDLVCADAEGNTVHSERTWHQRNLCGICRAE